MFSNPLVQGFLLGACAMLIGIAVGLVQKLIDKNPKFLADERNIVAWVESHKVVADMLNTTITALTARIPAGPAKTLVVDAEKDVEQTVVQVSNPQNAAPVPTTPAPAPTAPDASPSNNAIVG